MSDNEDREIGELFAQMRRDDAAEAPPFDRVWAAAVRQRAATSGRRSMRRWLLPVPLAAAAMVLLVVLLGPPGVTPPEVLMDAEITVADWTSESTDFLALDDYAFLELASAGDLPAFNDESWTLPSDDLLEQADRTFGQEPRM